MLNLKLILYAPLTLESRKKRWEELLEEPTLQKIPELKIDVRETFLGEHFVVEFSESEREKAKELEKFCKGKNIPVTFKKTEHSP